MGIFDAFKKKEQPKPQSEREGTHEVILKSRSLVCDVEAFV